MIDTVHSLRHQHGLLLTAHGLHVISHDVVQSGQHPQALRDLGVHRSVDVVEQVERLRDELVAVLEVTLLDLRLTGRVEVVGVSGSGAEVLVAVTSRYHQHAGYRDRAWLLPTRTESGQTRPTACSCAWTRSLTSWDVGS